LEKGASITLCVWEKRKVDYQVFTRHRSFNLRYFHEDLVSRLSFLSPAAFSLQVAPAALKKKYRYIFAVGQRGVVIGNTIRRLFGGDLVYFNDEFPSCWPKSRWSRAEKTAVIRSRAIVVPDMCRASVLLNELELTAGPKVFALPNVPLDVTASSSINWYERLGVPLGLKLILHAGSVGDWVQIPEVLCFLRDWPANCALLIHSRDEGEVVRYRKSLSHLEQPGRVFWNATPLSQSELNSLILAACCTLGLYRNCGPNLEYMGMSSGKIMRSIALGVPVIASRLKGMEFIETHNLGVLIEYPGELPEAIRTIMIQRTQMAQNCIDFSRKYLSFETYFGELWAMLEDSVS
jgi:hypothetical protein